MTNLLCIRKDVSNIIVAFITPSDMIIVHTSIIKPYKEVNSFEIINSFAYHFIHFFPFLKQLKNVLFSLLNQVSINN